MVGERERRESECVRETVCAQCVVRVVVTVTVGGGTEEQEERERERAAAATAEEGRCLGGPGRVWAGLLGETRLFGGERSRRVEERGEDLRT